MIGFLLTGHGEFSVGLSSSLAMIAGEQDNFEIVKFDEGVALEDYQGEVKQALDELSEKNEGVVVFTDLLGGTPFRIASTLVSEYENVEVITGTNLPMLLEGTMLRFSIDENATELSRALVSSAKEGITSTSEIMAAHVDTKESGSDDGI